MPLPRADLESLLRARKLDRTLTTSLPSAPSPDELPALANIAPPDIAPPDIIAATGLPPLDARLGGGFLRGHLSELVGQRSSGRTSVLLQALAAATARGELVALIDALDMLDVASASAAAIDLDRFLWVRGHVVTNPGMCRDTNQRALEQAVKALTLVLQAGNFGMVVLDVAEAPKDAIRRLPFTTWLRLQRIIEGSPTACLLVGTEPMARSSAGLTVRLSTAHARLRADNRLLAGLDLEVQVVRARARMHENTPEKNPVAVTTRAAAYV
jgi:recA bacterial DNA recombination protein